MKTLVLSLLAIFLSLSISAQIDVKNGKVGIGTLEPSHDIHMVGKDLFFGSISDSGPLQIKMFIDESGKVGIGTMAPTALLFIDSDQTGENLALNINNRFLFSGDGVLKWGQTPDMGLLSWDGNKAIIGAGAGNDLGLFANGTQKMTILQNGNIGIGIEAPLDKFHVSGDSWMARFTHTDGRYTRLSGNQLAAYQPNGTIGKLYLNNQGGDVVTQADVGIGTTAPSAKLDVNGSVKFSAYTGANHDGTATSILGVDASGNVVKTDADGLGNDGYIAGTGTHTAGGDLDMNGKVISSVDKLGIGTDTPGYHLDVNSGQQDIAKFRRSGTSGVDANVIIQGARGGFTTTDIAGLSFNNYDLNEGSGEEYTMAKIAAGMQDIAGNTGYLTLKTNSGNELTEKMRITSEGNIGIGTLGPQQKLHVDGSARIGGTATSTELELSANGSNMWRIGNGVVSGSALSLLTNSSADRKVIFDNDGAGSLAVGIGTTTPSAALTLKKNNDGIRLESTNPAYYTEIINRVDGAEQFYISRGGHKLLGTKNITSNPGTEAYISNYYGLAFATATANPTESNVRMYVSQAGNVGIGKTNPNERLDVNGTTKTTNLQITSGAGLGKVLQSDASGNASWVDASTIQTEPDNMGNHSATQDVYINANRMVFTNNVLRIGSGTGNETMTASNNTFIGHAAGNHTTTGAHNNFMGYVAGYENTTGAHNNFFGYQAGRLNTAGHYNNFMGLNSGYNNSSGSYNNFMGYGSGSSNTTASHNNFLGYLAGNKNTTGGSNNFIGNQAGRLNTTGRHNNFLGSTAGYANTTGGFNNFLGYQSGRYNTTGAYNNFIGRGTGFSNTAGNYNNFLGYNAGYKNTTGGHNNFFGYHSGYANTTGSSNTFLGSLTGRYNTTGAYNSFIGYHAGRYNTTGAYNNFIGRTSGYSNTTGNHNNFFGYNAGYANTTGNYNTFLGHLAGRFNTTGAYNNFLGQSAGYSNAAGSHNNFFGYYAGYDSKGSHNIFLGHNTGRGITTGNYNTIIGGSVTGLSPTLSNHIILADGQGNKRIVADNTGKLQLPAYTGTTHNGTPSSILGVDASGNVIKTDAASILENQIWSQNGTDAFYNSGHVGIGIATPGAKLHVAGDILANDWLRVAGNKGLRFESHGGGFYMQDATWIRTLGGKNFYHDSGIMRTDGIFQVGPNGNRMVVNANGNVGIGTAPSSKLHVNGDLTLGKTNGTRGLLKLYGSTPNKFSTLFTSNGNLHIDAGYGSGGDQNMYLNYYNGGHVYFGTGQSGWHSYISNSGSWNINQGHINGNRTNGYLTINANSATNNGSAIQLYGNNTAGREGELAFVSGQGGKGFKFYNYNGSGWSQDMHLKSNGQLTLSKYAGSGHNGTPTSVLGVDANGNVVKTSLSDLIGDDSNCITHTIASVTAAPVYRTYNNNGGYNYPNPISNIIDGDMNTVGSTGGTVGPQVNIDLGSSKNIGSINLYFDDVSYVGAYSRNAGIHVFVSATPFTSNDISTLAGTPGITHNHITGLPAVTIGQAFNVDLFNSTGRYIMLKLYRSGNHKIAMREVEVLSCVPVSTSNYAPAPENKTSSNKVNDKTIEKMQDEIDELKSLLMDLTETKQSLETTIQVALENSIELETPYISQNMPNPTRSQAIIKYFIPKYATSATVRFFSMGGQVMKEVDIDQTGQGQLDVDLDKMISGSYMYGLIVDGVLIDTKTMIIVK